MRAPGDRRRRRPSRLADGSRGAHRRPRRDVGPLAADWPRRHGFSTSAARPDPHPRRAVGRARRRGPGRGRCRAADRAASGRLRRAREHRDLRRADARASCSVLADEQAALRRVAELVARGAVLDEVFSAVATEASELAGRPGRGAAAVRRRRAPCRRRVQQSGPARAAVPIDDDNSPAPSDAPGGPVGPTLSRHILGGDRHRGGVGAGVAVPVTVEGRVWGALTASTPDAPLPAGTEERLDAVRRARRGGDRQRREQGEAHRLPRARRGHRRRDPPPAPARRPRRRAATARPHDHHAQARPGRGRGRRTRRRHCSTRRLSHAERANSELRDVVRGILPAVAHPRRPAQPGSSRCVADLAAARRPVASTAPRLPRADRDHRLLHRRRGADERGQARARESRNGRGPCRRPDACRSTFATTASAARTRRAAPG